MRSVPPAAGTAGLEPGLKKRAGLLCLCGQLLLKSSKVQNLFCDPLVKLINELSLAYYRT